MRVVISDEFDKEFYITKSDDIIYIDMPKERTAEMMLKVLKVVLSQLIKNSVILPKQKSHVNS